MKRKPWLILLLLAALAGGWYLYRQQSGPAISALRTTGTVEGVEVDIAAKIADRVASLPFSEGDTIRAGEVVLTLEGADLAAEVRSAAATVDQARAGVRVAEAALEDQHAALESARAQILAAEADLRQAETQIKDAERHLEQNRRLYEQQSIARESLDAAVTAREAAAAARDAARARLAAAKAARRAVEAQLRVAQSQLAFARAGVRQAEADLAEKQAKLADTTVVSPITGTVVYKAVEQGETVTPGLSILTVVDLKRVTVRVDIDEARLGSLHIGDKAFLQPPGRPEESIAGHIAAINRYADFATQKEVTGGREDIRTFRVTIAVDEQDTGLLPGMTVRVTIPLTGEEAGDAG